MKNKKNFKVKDGGFPGEDPARMTDQQIVDTLLGVAGSGMDDSAMGQACYNAWMATVQNLSIPDCLDRKARVKFLQAFVYGWVGAVYRQQRITFNQ